MGNAVFPTLSVSLLTDGELERLSRGSSAICGAVQTNALALPKPEQMMRSVVMKPDSQSHICLKLRKSTQLQLRTLFQAYKKSTAEIAALTNAKSAESATSDPAVALLDPLPTPCIPVISVRIRVLRGSLKSAYMAINRPFPDAERHIWSHLPTSSSITAAKLKRKEPKSSKNKTVGHRLNEDGKQDDSLGATGCVFDMTASATEFFSVGQYFLSLNSGSLAEVLTANTPASMGTLTPTPSASSPFALTELQITARVLMRTLPPPPKPLLKSSLTIKTTEQRQEEERKEEEWRVRLKERKKKEEEEKEAERVRKEQIEADWVLKAQQEKEAQMQENELKRLADVDAATTQAPTITAATDPDDPFATPRSQSINGIVNGGKFEHKYDDNDPFNSARGDKEKQRKQDDLLFGDEEEEEARRKNAKSKDPFASMPPTPMLDSARKRQQDPLFSGLSTPLLHQQAHIDSTPSSGFSTSRSDRTDILSSEPDMPHPPPVRDVLSSLRTPPANVRDTESLSMVTTPRGAERKVIKDVRVLDSLPDQSPIRAISTLRQPVQIISRSELNTPLESLPQRQPPVKVDVLASELTPRLEAKRMNDPNQPHLSRMPSLTKLPEANLRVLDSVETKHGTAPVVKQDVLSSLPTPPTSARRSHVTEKNSSESISQLPSKAASPVAQTRQIVYSMDKVDAKDVDELLGSSSSKKSRPASKKPAKQPQRPVIPPLVLPTQRPQVQPDQRAVLNSKKISSPMISSPFSLDSPLGSSSSKPAPAMSSLDELDDLPSNTPVAPPNDPFDDSLFDAPTPVQVQKSQVKPQQPFVTATDTLDLLNEDTPRTQVQYDSHALDEL